MLLAIRTILRRFCHFDDYRCRLSWTLGYTRRCAVMTLEFAILFLNLGKHLQLTEGTGFSACFSASTSAFADAPGAVAAFGVPFSRFTSSAPVDAAPFGLKKAVMGVTGFFGGFAGVCKRTFCWSVLIKLRGSLSPSLVYSFSPLSVLAFSAFAPSTPLSLELLAASSPVQAHRREPEAHQVLHSRNAETTRSHPAKYLVALNQQANLCL